MKRKANTISSKALKQQEKSKSKGIKTEDGENAASVLPKRTRRGKTTEGQQELVERPMNISSERIRRQQDDDESERLNVKKRRKGKVDDIPDEGKAIRCAGSDGTGGRSEPCRTVTAHTQNINQATNQAEDGCRQFGLPGQIKSIEVVDFMCHKHMQIDFSPHVTFISGQNGSGKSATLQALQCCLGVQAKKTGRASAFRDFIRSGASEAIVRVTLWNIPSQGFESYRHEDFGDTITVERLIRETTSSNIVLKDSGGKIKSRGRDELNLLLSCLSIDAANPINVMTQDAVRTFLAGNSHQSDQEKYELYVQATQLGTIASNLARSTFDMNNIVGNMKEIHDACVQLQQQRIAVESALKHLEGLQDWQDELSRLDKCFAWSAVQLIEESIKSIEDKLNFWSDTSSTEKLRSIEEEIQLIQHAVENNKKFLDSYTQEAKKLGNDINQIQLEKKKWEQELRQLKRNKERRKEELDRTCRQEKDLSEALDGLEDRAEIHHTQNEYVKKLEYADTQKKQRKMTKDRKEKEILDLEDEKKAAREELRSLETCIDNFEERNQHLRDRLASLNATSKDNKTILNRFGQDMVLLVQEVDNALRRGQFQHPPIGPIGRYLSVSNPEWSIAIEAAIGKHLNSFLVGSQQDYELMVELMRKISMRPQMKPTVCLMRFDISKYNISVNTRLPPSIPTVLSQLQCTDDQFEAPIYNYLVDFSRCEKVCLVRTLQEATRIAFEYQSVSFVYTEDGGRVYQRAQTTTIDRPPPQCQRPRIPSNNFSLEIKKKIEMNIEKGVDAIREKRRQQEEVKERLKHLDNKLRMLRADLVEIEKSFFQATEVFDDLMTQAPQDLQPSQERGRLHPALEKATGLDMSEKLLELAQAAADLRDQLNGLCDKEIELEAKLSIENEKLQSRIQEQNDLAANYQHMDETYEKDNNKLKDLQMEWERLKAEEKEIDKKRSFWNEKLEEYNTNLEKTIERASEVCSRKEASLAREVQIQVLKERKQRKTTKKDASTIENDNIGLDKYFEFQFLNKKITRLSAKIKEGEKEVGGTLEEKRSELVILKAREQKEQANLNSAKEIYKELNDSHDKRKRKLDELAVAIEQTVNARFNSYMRKRRNVGRIKVDRGNRKLTIGVRIGEGNGAGSGEFKDLKQLSGGERSYTTTSFVLALRHETESPFIALDEVSCNSEIEIIYFFVFFMRCILNPL